MSDPSKVSVVKTAENEVIQFTGVVARFIVSHPRLSAALSLVAGGLVGHFVR